LHIDIADGRKAEMLLTFDAKDVDDQPLGYIVPAYHLVRAFYAHLCTLPQVEIRPSTQVQSYRVETDMAILTLAKGKPLQTPLILAADGKHSPLRKQAGITASEWVYPQSALIATLHHSLPHQGVAIEQFTRHGPIALLPLQGGYHSCLVWSTRPEAVQLLEQLDEENFITQLDAWLGERFGTLALVSKRRSYPLTGLLAHHYTADRLALIGDAAHAIHPIAGQGLNLGLRDIDAITGLIQHAADPGDAVLLAAYEQARRVDNLSMVAITHGFDSLFASKLPALPALRKLGLTAIHALPPVKRLFMRYAMGERSFLGETHDTAERS